MLVNRAWRRWRAALDADPSDSALSDVDRLRDALLDLSAAHPSGIAQLFAGRPTQLSNLVREGAALSAAKRRVRAVADRADDYAQRYGLAPAFLAIGVATWVEENEPDGADEPPEEVGTGDDDAAGGDATSGPVDDVVVPPERSRDQGGTRILRAPVLLRPVSIRARRGDSDHDLALEPALEINPVLTAALRARGVPLDPAGLARGAFSPTGFDPRPALDRLRALGAATLTDFALDERLLVGTFMHPEQSILDDLDALAESMAEHEVLAALAGDPRSIAALAHPLPPMLRGDRPPDEGPCSGALDPIQT